MKRRNNQEELEVKQGPLQYDKRKITNEIRSLPSIANL